MNGKKVFSLCLAVLVFFAAFTACGCEHVWSPATCTSPKTCALCGAVEGEPLGHQWAEATCSAPKTCTVCGAQEGEPLAHTAGDWEIEDAALIGGKEARKCTVCGEAIEERAYGRGTPKDIDLFAGEGIALTAEQFREQLIGCLPDNVVLCTENRNAYRTWFTDGSMFSVDRTDNDTAHMRVWYAGEESFSGAEEYKQHIDAYFDRAEDFLDIAPYFFRAVDASFAASDAFQTKLKAVSEAMHSFRTEEYAVKMTSGYFVCRYQPDYEIMGKYYTGYYEIRFLSNAFYQECARL